jgi:sporulation protein YlmC with PRC-barrel domain
MEREPDFTPSGEHREHSQHSEHSESEQRDLQVLGHRMVTERGTVIGRVNDVLIDETATDDAWAVVSTGVLRSERFVPLTAAYLAADGDVVVPYDKNTVKRAPRADDHVLTTPVRRELAEYYGTA